MENKKLKIAKILECDFSERFIKLMKDAILTSHYKYGWVKDTYPSLGDAIKSLEQRLENYKKDGNLEWLVDVANFAMIEFMYPKHENAHYQPTDSDKSPGVVGGSAKELMDEIAVDYKI